MPEGRFKPDGRLPTYSHAFDKAIDAALQARNRRRKVPTSTRSTPRPKT